MKYTINYKTLILWVIAISLITIASCSKDNDDLNGTATGGINRPDLSNQTGVYHGIATEGQSGSHGANETDTIH